MTLLGKALKKKIRENMGSGQPPLPTFGNALFEEKNLWDVSVFSERVLLNSDCTLFRFLHATVCFSQFFERFKGKKHQHFIDFFGLLKILFSISLRQHILIDDVPF